MYMYIHFSPSPLLATTCYLPKAIYYTDTHECMAQCLSATYMTEHQLLGSSKSVMHATDGYWPRDDATQGLLQFV